MFYWSSCLSFSLSSSAWLTFVSETFDTEMTPLLLPLSSRLSSTWVHRHNLRLCYCLVFTIKLQVTKCKKKREREKDLVCNILLGLKRKHIRIFFISCHISAVTLVDAPLKLSCFKAMVCKLFLGGCTCVVPHHLYNFFNFLICFYSYFIFTLCF